MMINSQIPQTNKPQDSTAYHPKEIRATERPQIPYEHPDLSMYWQLFRQRLTRLKHKRKPYRQHDRHLQTLFQAEQDLLTLCQSLVEYVAEGFVHYSVWDHTHAYYPGRPSQQNARTDAVEGVSRVLPTLAAWLHHNRGHGTLQGLNQQPIDVITLLSQVFISGTDPQHPGYWGTLHDYDQRICEAADLALALWLAKEWIWEHYSSQQQAQIIAWFRQVNQLSTVDNNWHLFALTVQAVIYALTGDNSIDIEKYNRIKEFHVGDGWFRDGAKGNYDYYNAWGFHYSLYWLDQILPDFDREFIRATSAQFTQHYRYFFTPKGLPFFGRSACYRLAAAAPLIASVHQQTDSIGVGEAKRAFRTTLSYFISNGAMEAGAPTQGLFATDPRLIDNYSGPASSFWSLRALNIALFCGNHIHLWDSPETPLPIEQADFAFTIPTINASVQGIRATQEVVVLFHNDYIHQQDPLSRRLEKQSWRAHIQELLLGRATRPKNNLLRKGITCYSSKMSHFF